MNLYETYDGLQGTCHECNEPVFVTRREATMAHVFHKPCLDRIAQRLKRRTLKAQIEGKRGVA